MKKIEERAEELRIVLEHLAAAEYFCVQENSSVLFAHVAEEEWMCMHMDESGVIAMNQARLSAAHVRRLLHPVCETAVESDHG